MKNPLVKVMSNQVVSTVADEFSKFCITNKSMLLTVGGAGLSLATTAIAMRNGAEINRILVDTREALWTCNTKEERNQVYSLMLKELTPLVIPIVIFQGGTIACFILSKRNSDKLEAKLAETAGALSIAQTAVAQYQAFQKEAQESLGEKKYEKVMDDIYKNQEIDGRRFTAVASEGAPGEVLIIDKYSGRPFWSSFARISEAVERTSYRLSNEGGYERQTVSDIYDTIANPDLTPNELSDRFGYMEGDVINVHFSDTHYIFPNGTRIQAAVMNLYPEPELVY